MRDIQTYGVRDGLYQHLVAECHEGLFQTPDHGARVRSADYSAFVELHGKMEDESDPDGVYSCLV